MRENILKGGHTQVDIISKIDISFQCWKEGLDLVLKKMILLFLI